MERTLKDTFVVGLDDVTGKLTREQSVAFAQDVLEWIPAFMRAKAQEETVNGTSS